MTTWKSTYIAAVVHQAGDNPIINEGSTTVTICDEAGGAFISLADSEGTTLKLDPEELEMVCDVARKMLQFVRLPPVANTLTDIGTAFHARERDFHDRSIFAQ